MRLIARMAPNPDSVEELAISNELCDIIDSLSDVLSKKASG